MPTRIAINGFGRMGRLGLRALYSNARAAGVEVVHLNELHGSAQTAAHLLEFDTVHGRWDVPVDHDERHIIIDGRPIPYTTYATPGELDWAGLGVDIVVDCTGAFRTRALLQPYFDRGVKKVVVAAPVKDADLNIVMGCNDEKYDPAGHHLVTAASCTTNCLAPMVKVIHASIGIERGAITTLHNVTNTQVIVDAPHKDLRRARSALNSLIPTTTGSATAIGMIYPELQGRLNGSAVRVPLLNASITDATFQLKQATTAEHVNRLFADAAASGPLKDILGYETRPLVSADYVNDPRSGIIDAPSTMVVDETMLKVLAWYDNEWGYANRMMELTAKVAGLL